MTTRDPDFRAPKRTERLAFDRYVLDLERGCLLLDGNEIALRPKTFGVLSYLVKNCARLISKDELFAAVWPNIAVTDDALVQSIGELRRAFGDDGPRLIKTVPRRGYRLECNVSPFSQTDQSSTETFPVSADSLDEPRPPNCVIASRTPLRSFETAHASARLGRTALVAFTVLVAAGTLSSGIWAAWKFPGVLGYGGRATTQNPEISTKPAVAILPFLNQSGEASREYFTDGLTQDIINAVGRFSELTVMSWNAVLPYKGRPASPAEIAHDLAVHYQVEGSVRQTGDRVRVSVQLVDMDGRVLWSARFDEAFADVFALQDKITTQIAGTLAIRVTDVEQRRAFARPTENLEAYDYVLRSRPALQRPARANNVEARALLRHAIQLDPGYAAAYAALAETYHIAVSMGWAESPTEYLSRAEEMANKALSFDDSEVRAHIVLGRIHIFYHRYEQAMAEMGRALAINSNDANGLAGRGNCLMWMGQTDAAIEALEAARRIDPEINAIDRFALSLAYYLKRRYVEAIEQAELNLRGTAGANFSRDVLVASYAQNNQTDEAARVVAIMRRMDPAFDPREFGSKFLNPADLEHLRDGFRKAGLYASDAGLQPPVNDR
jgi:TolB-like protein/DNA-binding winged helix-turn-helix (wHTH) protein